MFFLLQGWYLSTLWSLLQITTIHPLLWILHTGLVCQDWFLMLWVSGYLMNQAITLPCVPAQHLLNMSRQLEFLSLTSVIISWSPFGFYDRWFYFNCSHFKHSISIHRISVQFIEFQCYHMLSKKIKFKK